MIVEPVYFQVGGIIGVSLGFILGFPPLLKECIKNVKNKNQ